MIEIQRDIHLKKLIACKHNGMIKVVTGVRRCGKSYLLFNLFHRHLKDCGVQDDHIIKVDLEDRRNSLSQDQYLEFLGNKSLLEKRINIRASDYRFADKLKYYNGYENGKVKKEGTQIYELQQLATTHGDFTEQDIKCRDKDMMDKFFTYLSENGLLK